jgi:tRNA (guanine-N7-)-methyltransferase
MPNFHAKEVVVPKLPAFYGETTFHFKATTARGEELIFVTCKNEDFLLKIQKHKDSYLLKGDKISRPTQVSILQKALRDLRDLCGIQAYNSNIDIFKDRRVETSPYLKKIEYFANEFEEKRDILIEIGFGSGRHLLYQAKKNPNSLIVGIEIHKPSIEQVLKQCELQDITNVLILDYDARVFLEFLPSNSAKQIFVHFPVPWDKKPHRRVMSERFINEAKRVLQPHGTLELRTDSDNYFEYSFFEIMKQNKIEVRVNKNRDLEISSKYEDRWKRQEKNIYDITMYNFEDSPSIAKIEKLRFENPVDFRLLREKFEKKVVRGVDFFAHFEEMFEIDAQSGFLRVSFGGGERNEHNYIYITPSSTAYFPDNVLATKDNVNAHKLIEEILHGTCH